MKKWIKDNLELIITIGVAITMISAGFAYFAKAKDLKFVDMRLEQKIVNDGVYDITRQMQQLERKYKTKDCTKWQGEDAAYDSGEYERMKLQLEAMKKKRDAIIQKTVQ
jgi:predicted negative regulator of RcsB-dependent stress response